MQIHSGYPDMWKASNNIKTYKYGLQVSEAVM